MRGTWGTHHRLYSLGDEETGDEGFPFGVEGGAAGVGADARIPVFGVGAGSLFAMEVGMDGHPLPGFELVDKAVSLGPIAFGVPPEGCEEIAQFQGRKLLFQRIAKLVQIHVISVG